MDLQYKLWRGDDFILSRVGALEVEIVEGKTSSVIGYPKSALFHWGCLLKPLSP